MAGSKVEKFSDKMLNRVKQILAGKKEKKIRIVMQPKNINQLSMKNVTVLFAVILSLLFVIVLLVRIELQYRFRIEFNVIEFTDTILSSILGIIIPLLIFNVFYEYLVRIYSSREISEKITETIMSNKDVVDSFDFDTKKQFVKTTLQSILQKEKGDVVFDMVSPYLQSKLNLRREFKYTIVLEDISRSECCKWENFIHADNYILIRENLSYTKIYTDETGFLPDYLSIGFFIDECTLDRHFKNKDFIFRENFSVGNEELELIRQNKEVFVNDCMNVRLYINESKTVVNSIDVADNGIVISYKTPAGTKMDEVRYDISFSMPNIKEKNTFQVVLCEPTYRPQIRLIYPREQYNITTIPFFDESYEEKIGMNDIDGLKEIDLKNWVLPRSGAVFIWNKKLSRGSS